MQRGLKGLLLLATGYFLFSRIANGTLFFYINNRFAWLTMLAVIGFFLVGSGYLYQAPLVRSLLEPGDEDDDDEDDPTHQHDHDDHGHDHGHDHGQRLTRLGIALVLLPVILGTLIPPKPLGASALDNREVSVGGLSSAIAPNQSKLATSIGQKNILDWLLAFDRAHDPAAFAGQHAKVLGFVYRDGRFAGDEFMVSRFVVSCCVADASPIGLIVRWPETPSLAQDQWIEVAGHFEPGEFDGKTTPILVTEVLTKTEAPDQPYLFP